MHRGLDDRVGDRPQAVLGPFRARKGERRRPLADDIGYLWHPADSSLVDEPEWLEADLRGAHQRQAVFLGAAMSALMRQNHAILVRLQPQRGDQVSPSASVELDLVHVYGRLVRLDDSAALPLFEGLARKRVIGARPRDMDHGVRRKRLV